MSAARACSCRDRKDGVGSWLWTNGVNTHGAAAKEINFDRLGKKVRPGTFGKISKVGKQQYPKGPSVKRNTAFAVTPLVLTPFVPLREGEATAGMIFSFA